MKFSGCVVAMLVWGAWACGNPSRGEDQDKKPDAGQGTELSSTAVSSGEKTADAPEQLPESHNVDTVETPSVSSASTPAATPVEIWLKRAFRTKLPADAEHLLSPVSAKFTENGTAVFSLDRNGILSKWNLTSTPVSAAVHADLVDVSPDAVRFFRPFHSLVPTSDRRLLAIVNNEVHCLDFRIWAHRKFDIELPDGDYQLSVSSDQELFFVGGFAAGEFTWRIYQLPMGCARLDGYRTPHLLVESKTLKKGPITSGTFDNHNRYLAMGTSLGHILVWKQSDLKIPALTEVNEDDRFAWKIGSPSTILGPTPRSVSHMVFGLQDVLVAGYYDGQVLVWNLQKNKVMAAFAMKKGAYPTRVAVDAAGKWIAAGGVDGSLWLWNMQTKKRVLNSDAHSFGVTSVDFSADGTQLLSASIDGTFSTWKVPAQKPLNLERLQLFGEKKAPPVPDVPPKTACEIAENEMRKACFYLNEEERNLAANNLLSKRVETDEEIYSGLKCIQNRNGSAWGLLPHEVDYATSSYKVWLLFVDKDGSRYWGGRHKSWTDGNWGFSIGNRGYFDFDADGVNEVMWSAEYWDKEDYSSDGSDSKLVIKTFKNGEIVDFKYKGDAQSIADVDHDGTLDLVVRPFYGVTMRSCGHSIEATHPVGPRIAAFSRGDGTFSQVGQQAEKYYKSLCPSNVRIAEGVKDGDMFDNDVLRHNIACAVLWGASVDQIHSEIRALCENHRIDSDCMDGIWFQPLQKGCIGMNHLLDIATATPPLVLK